MNLYDLPPLAAVLDGGSRLIEQLSTLLAPVAGAGSAAAAILLVTLLVRAVLIPVGVSQLRAQRTRARLAPRIRLLQRLHRSQPERLQRELSALYAAEKASPLAGCLPLLAQAPVLALVYALFNLPMIAGHANPLLAHTLLGAPLGQGFLAALGSASLSASATGAVSAIVVGGVVIAVVLVVALLTRRLQQRTAAAMDTAGTVRLGGTGSGGPSVAPGGAALTRLLSWAPLVSVVFVAIAPLAAGLYVATSMTWTLAERALLPHLIPA